MRDCCVIQSLMCQYVSQSFMHEQSSDVHAYSVCLTICSTLAVIHLASSCDMDCLLGHLAQDLEL